jgi:hypothetical protein
MTLGLGSIRQNRRDGVAAWGVIEMVMAAAPMQHNASRGDVTFITGRKQEPLTGEPASAGGAPKAGAFCRTFAFEGPSLYRI